jgi:nicotinate phosphoribosyltransferase
MSSADPFAAKRQQMRDEFFAKLFLLGGWLGGTDTYKRTMWTAVPDVALASACYSLTFRKELSEPGADNQLIMAGHEAMLAQWFHRPLKRSDIALSQQWYATHSATKAFPAELWNAVLADQPDEDITLPLDIWGFPGGQTFLAHVPCLVFEGPGGLVSYLEPAMCRYFAPVIQATKARLMREATPRDAEFGLRSAPVEVWTGSSRRWAPRRCCATSWTPRRSAWKTRCGSSGHTRRPTASACAWIAATSPGSASCTSAK